MKGIKYQINGRNYFVRFRYYNERVVKCFLDDSDLFATFVGKSKVNLSEGDVYNKEEGEKVALERALEKRTIYINALRDKLSKDLDTQDKRDAAALKDKIVREQARFKKKEAKRIAWEQHQAEFNKMMEEAMELLEIDLDELMKNETDN
jgi:hypothetical protein